MLDLIRVQQLDIMLSLGSMTAIIAFFIVMTGMNTKKKKALFLMEFGATLLLLSARFCWIYNDHPGAFASVMSVINNFLDYFGIVIVLFAFNQYVIAMFEEAEGVGKNLIRFKINKVLMAIDSIFICLSPFTGLCYSLDENNNYSRGPAVAVCFVVPLVVLLIDISLIVQYYRKLSRNMRLSVLLFATMPFPGAVLQFVYYGLETTNITIVAMAVLLYIFDLADINKTADMSLRAIAANEAKSAFLSNMSHEIRTPINAVLGMNEMILRESDDPAIISYSENIKKAGSTLLGIINDILDISKIEAGKIEIIPVDYDVLGMIQDLVNMIVSRADAKGLALKLDIDRTIPKSLNGDEVRIKQVIMNILTNAVKYTEKGSVTFRLKYEKIPEKPDRVVLKAAVIDTGIGIKEEDMKKLFSKFERIEEKRNRNIEGTGLGMSITSSLLEMMGSSMKVESVYGRGSTFSFELEQKVVSWEELGDIGKALKRQTKKHDKYHERLKAPNARVLVVDDNEMNLEVFKGLLKQTLMQVDTAGNSEECLKLSGASRYDVIFLDHMMPGKDGIETLKELKAETGNPNIDTPVICLTANAISGAREQYLSAGFNDYLTKPVDPDKLEDMLIKYLKVEKTVADDPKGTDLLAGTETIEADAGTKKINADAGADMIDINAGIKFTGSKASYLRILGKFTASVDEKTEELDRLFSDKNWDDYAIKMHSLKSSLKTMGAVNAGVEAQALENAAKQGDHGYIGSRHAGFIDMVSGLKEQIASIMDDLKKEDPMKAVYEEIRKAAEDMDSVRLDSIFSGVDERSIPEKDRELLSKLKASSDEFDYDAVIEMLSHDF